MARIRTNLLWSFLIVLTLTVVALAAAGPRVSFDKETNDLGRVLYGATVVGQFTVMNIGDETLIIWDIQVDCGCTQILHESQELSPGATSRIIVEFDTTLGKPGKKQRHVHVRSNDPSRPEVTLTLLAEVVHELNIDQQLRAGVPRMYSASIGLIEKEVEHASRGRRKNDR